MKPICVQCHRFFRPSHNGIYFLEGMPKHNDAKPGLAEADSWRPYKLWSGDEWECRGCGATIIVGTGRSPVSEHYQPDFDKRVAQLSATDFQVNDC